MSACDDLVHREWTAVNVDKSPEHPQVADGRMTSQRDSVHKWLMDEWPHEMTSQQDSVQQPDLNA